MTKSYNKGISSRRRRTDLSGMSIDDLFLLLLNASIVLFFFFMVLYLQIAGGVL
ncbi:MAG: hypothetical protein ACFFDM_05675 [Candidatus Thorarchaeota archaeon]